MPSLVHSDHSPSGKTLNDMSCHPLASLHGKEIEQTASLIRNVWPETTELWFKAVTLLEPPKDEMLRYIEAEDQHRPLPRIDRKAFVNYYLKSTVSKDHNRTFVALV